MSRWRGSQKASRPSMTQAPKWDIMVRDHNAAEN